MNKRLMIFGGGSAVVIIVALIITFTVVANQHKPGKTVAAFNEAIEDDDMDTLKDLIEPDKKNVDINKKSLSAFSNYLKTNNESYQVIKEGFKKQIDAEDFGSSNAQVSLFKDGKTLGVFPDYKMEVKTVGLKVKGPEKDNEVSLAIEGSKKPLDQVDEEEDVFGPVLPGEYNIEATIQNELGEFSKEEETDVWGDSDVSFLIDNEKLVRDNENIQKDIVNAANEFNENMSVYVTSGFDSKEFTNVTDDLKDNLSMLDNDFKLVKDYIEKIESQFLKSTVDMEKLDLSQFDGDWQAEVTMLVTYDEKMQLEGTDFEDLSYTELRDFSLIYDPDEEKWIVDDILGEEADESDADSWDDKEEIKVDDAPVRKWKKDGKDDSFI